MGLFYTNRSDLVTEVCNVLRAEVYELALVKPYNGEIDRYGKKSQVQSDMFPAEINLQFPFALVISKSRNVTDDKNRRLSLRHDLSIYVGVQNIHDFASTDTPDIFNILKKCAEVLHDRRLTSNSGTLRLVEEGEYLTTTDLFMVYDQRYYQRETAL